MVTAIDLVIDVSSAAGLAEPAHIAATVTLPDAAALSEPAIVCFAKPGGGYSRGYFTFDLPGPARGAQADWHARRGWIFVSVDHLGVGGSSTHAFDKLDYATLAAAAIAAETEILRRLSAGEIGGGFPAIRDPVTIGIGQSMGGCMTIVQQGRYHCYDGIGVLGYSAIFTHPPVRPGREPVVLPWFARDTLLDPPVMIPNAAAVAEFQSKMAGAGAGDDENPMLWGFHYDDIDRTVALADLERFAYLDCPDLVVDKPCPPWGSRTIPGAVAFSSTTPGIIATEAAAVRVPVLVALGERDSTPDVKGEPRAYRSSASVDLFVCPRMGHMHNFAGTREIFWERIDLFAQWVGKRKTVPGY